jgi:RNA polymerase-associated protein RTF1
MFFNKSLFIRGDEEETLKLQQQLVELEERANELDKLRTSTISSISYINDRNRKRNVEEAEKAILVRFHVIK